MGWSNVGAIAISTSQVILLDNAGNVVGTLDGSNGLVIYGLGDATNPGFQVNGAGDMLFGGAGFTDPLTLDLTIEAGGNILSSTKTVVGLIIGSGAIDVARTQATVWVLSAPADDSETPQIMMSHRTVAANPGVSGSPQPEIWHDLTLANSWVNVGGAFQTAQYRAMPDGTVMCRGSITSGTATTFATLPAGWRPPATVQFAVGGGTAVAAGASLRVGVASTGVMTINGENVIGGAFAIDGIRFAVPALV